jgi:fimbrial isopeptide formation D2 family protein
MIVSPPKAGKTTILKETATPVPPTPATNPLFIEKTSGATSVLNINETWNYVLNLNWTNGGSTFNTVTITDTLDPRLVFTTPAISGEGGGSCAAAARTSQGTKVTCTVKVKQQSPVIITLGVKLNTQSTFKPGDKIQNTAIATYGSFSATSETSVVNVGFTYP